MFGSKRKTLKQRVTELEEIVAKLSKDSVIEKKEKRPGIERAFADKIPMAFKDINVKILGPIGIGQGNHIYNKFVFFDFTISFPYNANINIINHSMQGVFKDLAENNRGFTFCSINKEGKDKQIKGVIHRRLSIKFKHVQ